MNNSKLHISELIYKSAGFILFCFYAVISYFISLTVSLHSSFLYFDPRFINTFFALIVLFVSLYPSNVKLPLQNYVRAILTMVFLGVGIVSFVVPMSYRLLVGFGILSLFVIVERILTIQMNEKKVRYVSTLSIVALIPAIAPVFSIPSTVQTLVQLGLLSVLYHSKIKKLSL